MLIQYLQLTYLTSFSLSIILGDYNIRLFKKQFFFSFKCQNINYKMFSFSFYPDLHITLFSRFFFCIFQNNFTFCFHDFTIAVIKIIIERFTMLSIVIVYSRTVMFTCMKNNSNSDDKHVHEFRFELNFCIHIQISHLQPFKIHLKVQAHVHLHVIYKLSIKQTPKIVFFNSYFYVTL